MRGVARDPFTEGREGREGKKFSHRSPQILADGEDGEWGDLNHEWTRIYTNILAATRGEEPQMDTDGMGMGREGMFNRSGVEVGSKGDRPLP